MEYIKVSSHQKIVQIGHNEEELDMDKKYLLVEYMIGADDKRKPNFYFGGYNQKYPEMINITIRECAYIFEDKKKAELKANLLNRAGYEFVVEEAV